MNLELVRRPAPKRVSPQTVLDYEIFARRFHEAQDVRGLKLFEKFFTASKLIREGYDTYLDPFFKQTNDTHSFHADAGGLKDNEIIVAFCPTREPDKELWNSLREVSESENARALIISTQGVDSETIEDRIPGAIHEDKIMVETLGWFDDTLEDTLRQTLRTIELMVNETRMRMLAPLLGKSALKKEFRARINPKLVYHNIAELSKAGILDEPSQGTYELSRMGETVLAEFLTFLERTRRTLDDQRNMEVKQNGR
ncbi:hypothetical protein J2P12_02070 [Candidatus Bathyarchaeota archaeon]|nr:hypothetical protein [Candidatus Bathyarchaeota archaeon]